MGDRIPDDEADEIVSLLAAGDGKIDITESTEVVVKCIGEEDARMAQQIPDPPANLKA